MNHRTMNIKTSDVKRSTPPTSHGHFLEGSREMNSWAFDPYKIGALVFVFILE
jgi:hypothetical protein